MKEDSKIEKTQIEQQNKEIPRQEEMATSIKIEIPAYSANGDDNVEDFVK